MKRIIILALLSGTLINSCAKKPEVRFEKYFRKGSLRIDYFHSGDAVNEKIDIDKLYRYDNWAGSRVNLVDKLNHGDYWYRIYDSKKGVLIYSRGFDSYFEEYQYTTPAINGEVKEYHESALIPLPKSTFTFVLAKRDKEGEFHEVFRRDLDPAEAMDPPFDEEVKIYTTLDNGSSGTKADILFVAEGYTKDEEQKFQDDLQRFTDIFFRAEPCKSYKDMFNIRGVFKASEDSGVDEPTKGIDKNTAVNASFNSLGSERYLLTEDNKSLRDIAGHAPYDALYIIVNHSRYGGGGIYNFYCVFTSDNNLSDYLMVHEFGHSFFGLADEYYTSSTSYNDFYPAGYEPNEPNITAMLDPDNLKWKDLLTEGLEIPTPWGKERYDSLSNAGTIHMEKLEKMKEKNASEKEIMDANDKFRLQGKNRREEMQEIIHNPDLLGKVGAFEGAGYASKGLYRPSLNCIMFSHEDFFCPVCQDAMIKVIKNYAE